MVFHISLKIINEADYKFLFNLLKNRDEIVNISHKKMPSFAEHKKFVKSKPYTRWYIIYLNNKRIGSAYLSKQDEIAIHLINEMQHDELMNQTLNLIIKKNPRNRYSINSNPKNKKLINFLKKNNFKLVQYSYELVVEKNF